MAEPSVKLPARLLAMGANHRNDTNIRDEIWPSENEKFTGSLLTHCDDRKPYSWTETMFLQQFFGFWNSLENIFFYF